MATPLQAAESIFKLPHLETKLENGLKVYLVKYPSPRVVSYQIVVHVGSRNEVEKGKSGFAHFFEHLMFRGTKNLSGKEFNEAFGRVGARFNAFTDLDITNYHSAVSSDGLPTLLKVEADRFMNLSFPEKLLRDEAGAVLGEYNKTASQPEFLLEEKLVETAFQKHPYAHTTLGYKKDILQYTERYADVWPFFKNFYRPSRTAVVVVGDIELEPTLKLVKDTFGSWKEPATKPLTIPQEPDQKGVRRLEVPWPKPTQTRVVIAFKVPGFSTQSKEFAALELIRSIYFSPTSSFQKEYRFGKKWIDSVYVSGGENIDPFLWKIQLRLSKSGELHQKEIEAAVNKTLQKLQQNPPEALKLNRAIERFSNQAATGWFKSPENLAYKISHYTNLEPDLDVLNRVVTSIESVTPQALSKVAQKFLVESRKTTLVLRGPS